HSRGAITCYTIRHAIPCDTRLEFTRQVCRVFSGKHRQHLIEYRARKTMVWVGSPDEIVQISGIPVVDGCCCNNYLGQNIECVLHDVSRLNLACTHRCYYRGDLHRIVPERWNENSATCDAERMSCATDSLQRGGYALR